MSNEQNGSGSGGNGDGVDWIVLIADLSDWEIVIHSVARMASRLRRSIERSRPDRNAEFNILYDQTLELFERAFTTWTESIEPRLMKGIGSRELPPWPP